jgi:antitoxin (DNA-binding transcriptional repressor) of toxin-antitoxin stability system
MPHTGIGALDVEPPLDYRRCMTATSAPPVPIVVGVTDLRRRLAGIIEDALKSGAVVFVTQGGVATCVLLAHKQYATLMEDSESTRQAGAERRTGAEAAAVTHRQGRERITRPTMIRVTDERSFLCDPETAEFFLDQGLSIDAEAEEARARGSSETMVSYSRSRRTVNTS